MKIINLTNAYIRKLVEIVQNTDVSHAQKMDAIGKAVQYEWDALSRRTATVIFDKKNIIRYKPLNLSDFFEQNNLRFEEAKYRRTQHNRAAIMAETADIVTFS